MPSCVVRITDVHLSYPLLGGRSNSIRGMLADRIWKRGANAIPTGFAALKGISFSAYENDRVALIGANGAGKTTLLRVISGIFAPDAGKVEVAGSIIPLLGHFPGVNADATGYENIKLAAYTMGFSTSEVPDLVKDVESFTGLGDFLNMPIKTYSAGMSAKLLFAIVTSFNADVFALDEFSFATGDHVFKERARERALRLMERAKTVFLASHDDAVLRSVCNKALLLQGGCLVASGTVDEVLAEYHARSFQQ